MLRDLALRTPPNAGGGIAELIEQRGPRAAAVRPALETSACSLDLFTKSAADFLDQWFESEVVKGALRLRRHRRRLRLPAHAGHRLRAAAPLLRRGQRQAGRVGPRRRRHGRDHRRPWRASARARGAVIRTEAPRGPLDGRGGRACGVGLASRRARRARALWPPMSAPKLLFRDLVPEAAVEPESASPLHRASRRAPARSA